MSNGHINEAHLETFRAEVSELVQDLEESLLELESAPDDEELIGRVFRAMHTIKGAAAMFGYAQVTALTHEVENAFDEVRSGTRQVEHDLIDITLRIRDFVRASVLDDTPQAELNETEKMLRAKVDELFKPGQAKAEEKVEDKPKAAHSCTYRIRLVPPLNVFNDGTRPLLLLDALVEMGPHCVVPQLARMPKFSELNPEQCYFSWDVVLTTGEPRDQIEDVFVFVPDECEVDIELIDDGNHFVDEDYKQIGDILVERGDVTREDVERVLGSKPKAGEMLLQAGVTDPHKVASALAEQQQVRTQRKKRQSDASASIRVATDKLDDLVDLVGELVIAQARLSQIAGRHDDTELRGVAEEMERLAADLRDSAMGIRMLPIGTTFTRFRRLVRDLSDDLGKEVKLVTEGGETALDKTVIERLGDPLVHIIRNSIDHGIEFPDEREEKGKSRHGTITLTARQSEANVILTIVDDGKGLDAERIKAKAMKNGLIPEGVEISDEEAHQLIFAAGLSTAETVSKVSGRGVGMDAVMNFVKGLRGNLRVKSKPDEGTTITITMPLSLAIVEGLLVRLADSAYVLPLALVEECIEAKDGNKQRDGASLAEVRGELVPYIRLRDWFKVPGAPPSIEQIVITNLEGNRFGFVVDQVVGQHQTVIKSLGKLYEDVDGLSGATVLGDGTLALILDAQKLATTVADQDSWGHTAARAEEPSEALA